MSSLWTASDVSAAVGGRLSGPQDWSANGVGIDSRELLKGEIFVPLVDARDGHGFIADAFAKGAAASLAARRPSELAPERPLVLVDDTFNALEALGRAARDRGRARRLGVTGSVGKTTTKTLAADALRAFGPCHASVRSYNNHWGVPLSLARMAPDCAFAVFEMGMNAKGEIRNLTTQVRPHVAMITAIGEAHLEKLGSLRAIAEAKSEIVEGLPPSSGVAVIPDAAAHQDVLEAACVAVGARILRVGETDHADVQVSAHEDLGEGCRGRIRVLDQTLDARLRLRGRHNLTNAAFALAAVAAFDLDPRLALDAMAETRPPAGRGAVERLGAVTLIDDSYNANPHSMRAAIAVLAGVAPHGGGRRIAVLGDMLELGDQSAARHAALADPLIDAKIDLVHLAGPAMRALRDALPETIRGAWETDAGQAASAVLDAVRPGDVVLVKGSRGMRLERVADALRARSQMSEDA